MNRPSTYNQVPLIVDFLVPMMFSKNMKACLTIIAISAAIFLTGCGDVMKFRAEAEIGIPSFHALFNQEKYSEIYSTMDKTFTEKTSEKKVNEFLGTVHRKLGNVKETQNSSWRINNLNGKYYIVLIQDTKFEDGTGTETFTYVMREGKAILQGYNINSMDLIVK